MYIIWPIALWNSYLSLISNNFWAIFSLGDHQITFVTSNRFCLLSKPQRTVNHLSLLTDKTKLDGTPSKIKWEIHVFWYTVFYVFKLSYIASEFASADIIFNIHWKKVFATKFHFFNGFTQTHHSLAKRGKSFSLMLPNFGQFLVLYLGCGSMT